MSDDYDATAAHDSADRPLEHIGEPVQDPVLDDAAHPDVAAGPASPPTTTEGEA